MELTITADRVREASANCPDADKVLRVLFPEAFPPKVQFPFTARSTWHNPPTLRVLFFAPDNQSARAAYFKNRGKSPTAGPDGAIGVYLDSGPGRPAGRWVSINSAESLYRNRISADENAPA